MEQQQKQRTVEEVAQAAIDDPTIPHIYANGFSQGVGIADYYLVLQLGARPVATVNLSFSVMKTLHVKLGELVTAFESITGQDLMTTDFVRDAVEKVKAKQQ